MAMGVRSANLNKDFSYNPTNLKTPNCLQRWFAMFIYVQMQCMLRDPD